MPGLASPQGCDLNGEIALLDGGALPRSVNKIGLGQHLTRAIQESCQEKRGPIRDRDGDPLAQKRPGLGIEDERPKAKHRPSTAGTSYLFGTFQEYLAGA
jgi:hypothetical protein